MEAVISKSLFEKQESSFDMLNKNWVFILLFSHIILSLLINNNNNNICLVMIKAFDDRVKCIITHYAPSLLDLKPFNSILKIKVIMLFSTKWETIICWHTLSMLTVWPKAIRCFKMAWEYFVVYFDKSISSWILRFCPLCWMVAVTSAFSEMFISQKLMVEISTSQDLWSLNVNRRNI